MDARRSTAKCGTLAVCHEHSRLTGLPIADPRTSIRLGARISLRLRRTESILGERRPGRGLNELWSEGMDLRRVSRSYAMEEAEIAPRTWTFALIKPL